jgi:hypothetical protein
MVCSRVRNKDREAITRRVIFSAKLILFLIVRLAKVYLTARALVLVNST